MAQPVHIDTLDAERAYQSKPNIAQPYPRKVVCIGDSHMGAAVRPNLFQSIREQLGASFTVIGKGVPGNLTADVNTRWATDVTAFKPEKVIILIGYNDVNTAVANATIEANWDTMNAAALAINCEPRFVLLFPFGGAAGWTGAKETARVTVNTYLRDAAYKYSNADDVLADWSNPAQPTILPAYDSGDGIHLTQAGYDRLATQIVEDHFGGGPVGLRPS